MSSGADDPKHILADFRTGGWETQPFERTYALARERPESAAELVRLALAEVPKGATFLDAALSFVPEADYPELVSAALDALEAGPNELADSVIAYASMQQLPALHPHLDRIGHLRPNGDTYYADWPWRESGTAHFAALRTRVEDRSLSRDERVEAWERLLETRHREVLAWASEAAPTLGMPHSPELYFQQVGFEAREGSFRQLYPERLFHLSFPREYRTRRPQPFWLERTHHPTWELAPAGERETRFGGLSEGSCAVCGGTLHHLLTLDPVPAGLGIIGVERLELSVCLSCLGWTEDLLFYHHEGDGTPEPVGYAGERREPDFPAEPLLETRVGLAETPLRWRWQDWALANGRESLHRLGGYPCWVQDADYPDCPECGRRMGFLLQLDTDLDTEDGAFDWGSGGIGYTFWCDPCRVSGFRWQCT